MLEEYENQSDKFKEKDEKLQKMNKLISEIDYFNEKKDRRDYIITQIRLLSISRAGFVLNYYRREFLKYFIGIEANELDSTCTKFDSELVRDVESTNWYRIIDLDCRRSIVNHFNFSSDRVELIKKNLTTFLQKFFKLYHKQYGYEYFQGFHDIALYVYLLFLNYESLGLVVLRRISDAFFLDYMTSTNHDNKKSHFKMEKILDILGEIIDRIDSKFFRFIKTISSFPVPPKVLSWILTFFTHEIHNPLVLYRILDYLILAEPYAIYHMTAHILIDETRKLIDRNSNQLSEDFLRYCIHFSNLDLSQIDYDAIIKKSEDSQRRINTAEIFSKYKGEFNTNSPYIRPIKRSYKILFQLAYILVIVLVIMKYFMKLL